MSNTKEPIKITKTDLIEKINAGWKKPELALHYGVPVKRLGDIVKQAGLRFRSFKGETAIFIDDTVDAVKQEIVNIEEKEVSTLETNNLELTDIETNTETEILEEVRPETKIVEEGLF